MKYTEEEIIKHTQNWVEKVVVGFNFCPFAKREILRNSIRYVVADFQESMEVLEREFKHLDFHDETETTLIIVPDLVDIDTYLDFDVLCNHILDQMNYEGIYQIATFHPDYCFEGSDDKDPANYTNRSPHPMIHLIREASLEKVLERYDSPEDIPERNVNYARELGLDKLKAILHSCFKTD